MIYGIGTDMVDIKRIERLYQQYRDAFALKILSRIEYLEWQSHPQPVAFLAKRFAAKEAFSKAIGLGIRMPMTWRNCEILNTPSGKPQIVLHGELAQWFAAQNLQAHITLSDESDYAASFCVVEQTQRG